MDDGLERERERHSWLRCRHVCQVNTRGRVLHCATRRCAVLRVAALFHTAFTCVCLCQVQCGTPCIRAARSRCGPSSSPFTTTTTTHNQQPTTNPQQPTTTHNNPQQPTTTHNNPQRPTTTHNNPQQPATTRNNPQQPATTRNNPQQPATTRNNPQQPATTRNNPQQPTTTHNNPQQPTTTHNNPQQPTTTHNNHNNPPWNASPLVVGRGGLVASHVLTLVVDMAGEARSEPGVCRCSATSPMMGDAPSGVVARESPPSGE